MIQTRGFLELSEQAMQIILQSDYLAIDEVKLIHAVREWAHVGSVSTDSLGEKWEKDLRFL